MQAIVEQSRIIRLPMAKVGAYTKITRAFQSFEQEYQREPDVEELMEMLGLTKDEIDEYFRANTVTLSFDMPLKGMEQTSLTDTIYDKDDMTPDQVYMQKNIEDQLNVALSHLSDREVEVISYYFGLNGKTPLTLEEIGDKFGLSRERVRQIKEKCIQRLKSSQTINSLQGYLHT
jgi:RNA polymerase primary sigma factor